MLAKKDHVQESNFSVRSRMCTKERNKNLIYLEAGGWFAPELSAVTEAGIVEAPVYSDEV